MPRGASLFVAVDRACENHAAPKIISPPLHGTSPMLLHLPRMDGHGQRPAVKNGPPLAGHGAEAVRDAIAESITTLPEQLRRSLAWDQGSEMAQHAQLRIETGLPIYFCDPHSPWQRGTNESTVAGAFERKAAGETNGAIADWMNAHGLSTRTGRMFTAHAIKDMLGMRFYVGVVRYKGNEYPGKHAGIVDEDLNERVQQRRRHDRQPRRQRAGPPSVLHGMLNCARASGGPTRTGRSRRYRARLSEVDARIRAKTTSSEPTLDDAAELFSNLPALWEAAEPDERRRLVAPLIERVYVDLDSSLVGAFTPSLALRSLLDGQ